MAYVETGEGTGEFVATSFFDTYVDNTLKQGVGVDFWLVYAHTCTWFKDICSFAMCGFCF